MLTDSNPGLLFCSRSFPILSKKHAYPHFYQESITRHSSFCKVDGLLVSTIFKIPCGFYLKASVMSLRARAFIAST